MESKKSDDILGPDFSCFEELPEALCPAAKGDYRLNEDTGSYVCPLCAVNVGWEVYDDRELFDEEEDADSGPMDEGADFVAEGENIQSDFTRDFDLRVKREDAINNLLEKLEPLDGKLAVYIAKNTREVVDTLRKVEESEHSAFSIGADLAPKIIAVASHMQGSRPSRETLSKLRIRPDLVYSRITILRTLLTPDKDDRIEREFLAIAKLIDMPESLALAAHEEFVRFRPISKVIIPYARHTAWLFVMGEKYGFKITQKDLIALSNSPRNATRQAIKDFREFLSNLNSANVSEREHDLQRSTNLE